MSMYNLGYPLMGIIPQNIWKCIYSTCINWALVKLDVNKHREKPLGIHV